MAPGGMRGFVESKSHPTASNEHDKAAKTAANKQQARENGLYFDTSTLGKPTSAAGNLRGLDSKGRTISPRPALRNDDHFNDVFDTDASLRDDGSSIDGDDDTLSFRAGTHTHNESKIYGEVNGHGQSAFSTTKQFNTSSYPPTTIDGSDSDLASRTSRSTAPLMNASKGFAYQPRPGNAPAHNSFATPQRPTAPVDDSSTRATVAPSPRSAQPARVTVVREATISHPPLLDRAQGIPFVRPATSRGLDMPMPIHTTARSFEQAAKDSAQDEAPEFRSSPPVADSNDVDMDYPPEEILSKTFSTLQDESVDVAPQQSALSHGFGTDLNAMLEHLLRNGDPERQRELLESLDINRWEEAGDWIVERMTDIMKRSVQLRKEKRRLAMELEKEIAQRHEAVNVKRQILRENLAGLREAGTHVLAVSTPKKRAR